MPLQSLLEIEDNTEKSTRFGHLRRRCAILTLPVQLPLYKPVKYEMILSAASLSFTKTETIRKITSENF